MKWAIAFACVASLAGLSAPAVHASPCDGLKGLLVPALRIDRATPMTQPVPYCRVEATIEKEIGVELWLPEPAHWNRRMLTGGVGGQAGSFNLHELARGVRRGYASASTDTGHKAADKHWLLKRPDRAANFAHRAHHLLAVKAKAVLRHVYGRRPDHAFFIGCSGGGRQALTEVQRYPRDYDGVIAGAPGVNTPAMSARRMWEMQRHSEWGAAVPPSVWKLVTRAAIAQCDGDDGVRDGVVADPRLCRFNPASLLCKPGEAGAQCLSPMQVDAVRTIYASLHDENGKRIDQGLVWTAPVSPAPLPEPFTPGPSYLATVLFAEGVHGDPAWDARQFRIARDLPAIDRLMNLHADDPAIDPFTRAGGKLILYQGWDDPLVSALSTLGYWDALSARFGSRLDASVRLFMAPGVDHCRGGPGADLFGGAGGDSTQVDPRHDMLSALEEWVLRGTAPETIIATKLPANGAPGRTQPLCVWPARAVWNGAGDPASASSYVCRKD